MKDSRVNKAILYRVRGSLMLFLVPLLKCVLARWFLDVGFQIIFVSNNIDFGDGYCHFWYPKPVFWHALCLHFGTLGDHGTLQGHLGGSRKETLGSRLG